MVGAEPRLSSGMVAFDVDQHVATVSLDRIAKLNALTAAMRVDIVTAFEWSSQSPDIRAVLLQSVEVKAFCVGVDLHEVADEEVLEDPASPHHRSLYEAVLDCTKPTIAAISGWTLGAGCELALACDVRVASDTVKIGLPEALRGMGGHFGSHMLVRSVPRAVAFRMLYTGEPLNAEQALSFGLVSDVTPVAVFAAFSTQLARSIARNAPLTVQRYKAALGLLSAIPIKSALHIPTGPNPYSSADRREGVRAFIEGRAPIWRGE